MRGKSLLRIYQRSGLWTFVFSMALLTDTLGLLDGGTGSAKEASASQNTIMKDHWRFLALYNNQSSPPDQAPDEGKVCEL